MKNWIRWKGLAAFIILIVLMVFVWLIVVDWVAEKAIETAGTKAIGARVDVARVDVTLFPAGVTVMGLAVTDPDKPMRNALAVKRLHAAIELSPLLRRKMIINDISVEGLRFNTARRSSGALPGRPAAGEKSDAAAVPPWLADMCGGAPLVQLTIPKAEEILGREPLQTLQQATDIRSRIKGAKAAWQDRLKELPNQQDLEAYRGRIEKLKGGGGLAALLGSANDAKALNADIQKDIKSIKDAQKNYQAELQELKKQSADLVRAPGLEAKRLQEKYALSPKGLANLSRMLFGPQACGWWQKGHHWYQRVRPYLSRIPAREGEPETVPPIRGKGLDVRFAETHPLPDFLIRKIHLDAQLEVGNLTGQVIDITSQPHVLGKPMTFKFLGRKLKQIQAINLNGKFNFVQPGNPHHTIKMLIEKLSLQDLDLTNSGNLPLSIAQAMTNLDFNMDLAGSKLDANINAQLQKVKMALKNTAASELSTAFGDAIASVQNFGISAALKGTDPEYIASLESDLDQILQKAVGQLVKKAGAKLESQLRKAISEKVKGSIGDTQSQMGGLDALGAEFGKRLEIGNNLLKDIKLPL